MGEAAFAGFAAAAGIHRPVGAGEVPGQAGNNHPTFIPTGVFQTVDGLINIQARGQKLWKRLTVAIGAPGLEENPDCIDRESRLENRDALNERINGLTSQKTTAEWVALLNEAGIPCGHIYSVDQTMADPQVQTLGMAPSVQYPVLGELRVVGVGALQVLHDAVDFVHAPPATKRDAGDERAHVVSRKKFVHGVFLLEWVVFGGRIGGLPRRQGTPFKLQEVSLT